MATATMGLRRRVPVNGSPSPTGQSSASSSTNKRSRSENNNSPSHGNLNSPGHGEPPAKKSRGTSTAGAKGSAGPGSPGDSRGRGASGKSKAGASAPSGGPESPAAGWAEGAPYAPGIPGLCSPGLAMPPAIPYMSTSMATFVGTATNLGKSSSVSYLDISNMTGGSLASSYMGAAEAGGKAPASGLDGPGGVAMPFSGASPAPGGGAFVGKAGHSVGEPGPGVPKKFLNDAMFNAYQPWVIKTYGDLAKTKTITIKKYARILRTLRGEEVNSAENSKFRFWVKSKGFHIGQPEGYDAKPADRIVGRHAVTSPGLDPPLYVPTQLPHNKSLNGAEGTVPPGRVYKKVAIVENFFDIIHAVHVDLEGRPGKHAGQKRTYRTITETYAFLPREAVTRFLLGCTECQRRPRTPSPTNLSNQSQATTASSSSTPLSPLPATALSASTGAVQSSPRPREASHPPESKSLFSYRHPKHQKQTVPTAAMTATTAPATPAPAPLAAASPVAAAPTEREEKYNPLSISNLLKKEPTGSGFGASPDALPDSRRTPESDRASSRSSASSKRRRMLPEGRTPSPQPTHPLPRPWSPGLDPKNTPVDYSLPITTSYLKHQQRILAEKSKAASIAAAAPEEEHRDPDQTPGLQEAEAPDMGRFSPAAGLIDTNLNLLATIQHLHCQVMLALTERLRASVPGNALSLPADVAAVTAELSVSARNDS
ncbi:uncharacterized protein LOC105701892 [Orussus abietinus]|uniref:uncharacterized protein LOC105701892 n=1 Tax=Orussus abietinus TaxID=222816 RepID=UPI000C71629F|nr:uncharacterized protein LOC105701892 [Orussus abietinus]